MTYCQDIYEHSRNWHTNKYIQVTRRLFKLCDYTSRVCIWRSELTVKHKEQLIADIYDNMRRACLRACTADLRLSNCKLLIVIKVTNGCQERILLNCIGSSVPAVIQLIPRTCNSHRQPIRNRPETNFENAFQSDLCVS